MTRIGSVVPEELNFDVK